MVRDVDVREDSTVVLRGDRQYDVAQHLVVTPTYTRPILGATGHAVLTGRVGRGVSFRDAPSIAEGLAKMILHHNVRIVGGSWGSLGSELLRLLRGNSMQVNVASWSPVAPADGSDTVVLQPGTIWVVGVFREVRPMHVPDAPVPCPDVQTGDFDGLETVKRSEWPPPCAKFMGGDCVVDQSTMHLPNMPRAVQKVCTIAHEGMTKVQLFVGDKPRRGPDALAER
jgi:hypothetical protein